MMDTIALSALFNLHLFDQISPLLATATENEPVVLAGVLLSLVTVLNPFVPENREGLVIAAFLLVVAIFGKVVTGLSVFGQPGINRLAIGVGMIPRGEVGLVFAAVGTASGVLSDSLNAAIIVMVILTTFVAPPLLRTVFDRSAVSTKTALKVAQAESVVKS